MTSKKQTNKDVERNLADIYEIAAICERSAKETYKTEADQIEAFRVRMNDIIKLFIDAIEETVDGWGNEVDDVNVDDDETEEEYNARMAEKHGSDDGDVATCDNCGKPVTEKDTEFIGKAEKLLGRELTDEETKEIIEAEEEDEDDVDK